MLTLVFVDTCKLFLLFFKAIQAEFLAQCKVYVCLQNTHLTCVHKHMLYKVEMLYHLPRHLYCIHYGGMSVISVGLDGPNLSALEIQSLFWATSLQTR